MKEKKLKPELWVHHFLLYDAEDQNHMMLWNITGDPERKKRPLEMWQEVVVDGHEPEDEDDEHWWSGYYDYEPEVVHMGDSIFLADEKQIAMNGGSIGSMWSHRRW